MPKYKYLPQKITIWLDLTPEENLQIFNLHLSEIKKLQDELLISMVYPSDPLYVNISKEINMHKKQALYHNPNSNPQEKEEVELYFKRISSLAIKSGQLLLH